MARGFSSGAWQSLQGNTWTVTIKSTLGAPGTDYYPAEVSFNGDLVAWNVEGSADWEIRSVSKLYSVRVVRTQP